MVASSRKDAAVFTVTVVARRTDPDGDDNGPAQDVDAIQQAIVDEFTGATMMVHGCRGIVRPGAEYEIHVAHTAHVDDPVEVLVATATLGMDVNGRPLPDV